MLQQDYKFSFVNDLTRKLFEAETYLSHSLTNVCVDGRTSGVSYCNSLCGVTSLYWQDLLMILIRIWFVCTITIYLVYKCPEPALLCFLYY